MQNSCNRVTSQNPRWQRSQYHKTKYVLLHGHFQLKFKLFIFRKTFYFQYGSKLFLKPAAVQVKLWIKLLRLRLLVESLQARYLHMFSPDNLLYIRIKMNSLGWSIFRRSCTGINHTVLEENAPFQLFVCRFSFVQKCFFFKSQFHPKPYSHARIKYLFSLR